MTQEQRVRECIGDLDAFSAEIQTLAIARDPAIQALVDQNVPHPDGAAVWRKEFFSDNVGANYNDDTDMESARYHTVYWTTYLFTVMIPYVTNGLSKQEERDGLMPLISCGGLPVLAPLRVVRRENVVRIVGTLEMSLIQ